MKQQKLWVAITAYNPIARINHLVNVLNEYMKYPYDFGVRVYIDYESQHDIELLDVTLEPFKKLNIDLGVLLRKIVPPNTHVFVVIDLPAGDTSVNMEGADTYGGIVHLTPEHEETAAAIASFSVKPASFTCQ